MYRIAISGSYGGCNLGDEAILHGLLGELRDAVEIETLVFSSDPGDTRRRHRVERAVRGPDLTREELTAEVGGLDLFILGGGGVLFDLWVRDHLREARVAEEQGVPVMVCAVGVGPLQETSTQSATRHVLDRAGLVTVRDQRSLHALEKLGVHREVYVTADPGLLLRPEPLPEDALKREGLEGKQRIVGMSVREPGPAAPDIEVERYHAMLASAADYMVDRFNADVVFVPMEPQQRDMQHSHSVIGKMHRPQRAGVLKGEYSAGQLLTLVGHFSFAVGMRLHFLVFAAIQRVPFVALPYASKVTGFIEDVGLESPPLQDLTIGQLLAYIDRSWDRQDALRAAIERTLPALCERARENGRLALGILRRGRPRAGEPATVRAVEPT